jgi:hypothetical protein
MSDRASGRDIPSSLSKPGGLLLDREKLEGRKTPGEQEASKSNLGGPVTTGFGQSIGYDPSRTATRVETGRGRQNPPMKDDPRTRITSHRRLGSEVNLPA